jgi:hypothetical protein
MGKIPSEFDFPPSNDLDDAGRRGLLEFHAFLSENEDKYGLGKILRLDRSHLITTATNLGHIDKREAMELLKKVTMYAKSMYAESGISERC